MKESLNEAPAHWTRPSPYLGAALITGSYDPCYGRSVPSSEDLIQWQVQELAKQLGPQARYLSRLSQRMQQRGWKSDDLLYARALRARDGVLSLIASLDEMQKERDKPQWMRSRGAKLPVDAGPARDTFAAWPQLTPSRSTARRGADSLGCGGGRTAINWQP